MKSEVEIKLFDKLLKESGRIPYKTPHVRDVVRGLKLDEKKAEIILRKWFEQGIYDYSHNLFYGWLVDIDANVRKEFQ